MSALAPNPQTSSGVGGAQDYSQYGLPVGGILPAAPPGGTYTDPTYLQQDAILRNNINQRYGAFLDQLGYTDANGNYIPGTVVQNASAAEDLARQGISDADLQNQYTMQRGGTLFSGYRGTAQEKLEEPYWQSIAKTELAVPQQMGQAYTGAENLVSAYNQQNLINLGNAAARATAWSTKNPPPPGTPYEADPTQGMSVQGDYIAPYSQEGVATAGVPAPITPMAEGGTTTQPTTALVGEQGPEVVNLPAGATVEPNQGGNVSAQGQQASADAATQAQLQSQALAMAAQARLGTPVAQGGPTYQTPQITPRPIDPGGFGLGHVQGLPLLPAHNPALYLHQNWGARDPYLDRYAANMWEGNHPGAMAGRAAIPDWVHDALASVGHVAVPVHTLPVVHPAHLRGLA
jgi:hypothetical protein